MGKSMVSCRFSQQNQSIDIYKTVPFLGYMLVIKYSSTILFANLGLKAPVTSHIRKYHVDHVDPRQESANEAAKIGDGELRFHGAQSLKSVDLSQSKMIHDLNLSCFRHAADTAPLEGLLILRCAIYDPLEGLQISKMRLSKMGVYNLIFWRLWHVAHAVVWSSGGWGWGGCINVLDEHFPYVTEHVAVVDMLHMLSDALLLDFLREPILAPRILPTKDSRWPKSTTNNISLLRLIIFEVLCGVNPIEPLFLVLNK